jgi:hypothetical protein
LNPFLTFWFWEKCCKSLIRTHWGAFVSEHTGKKKSVLAQLCFSHGWLSCSVLRSFQRNSDIIIIWDHLKLVEGMHTFHFDPTVTRVRRRDDHPLRWYLGNQEMREIRISWLLSVERGNKSRYLVFGH